MTRLLRAALAAALLLPAGPALAEDRTDAPVALVPPGRQAPERQALSDAWWTGPMLANSAAILPRGHALVETYLFDQRNADGDAFGSLTYLLYGVTDSLTLGAKPMFGMNAPRHSERGKPGIGDITLSGQYRLTSFDAAKGIPALALSVQETLPTGRYDRLGTHPADGLGGGAAATMIALYAQHYFWLPNGRIFRTRLNLSQTFTGAADIRSVSVYGTGPGFRGRARPGQSLGIGVSGEYSVTRSWVLALDLVYTHNGATRVTGSNLADPANPVPVRLTAPASDSFAIAPGIEYSWKPNLGVLFAARFIPRGHNVAPSITPAIALNYVY